MGPFLFYSLLFFRVIQANLPTESTGWQPRFYQLGDLRSGLKRNCILSLCEIKPIDEPNSHRVSIAYSNTAGSVCGVQVDLSDGRLLNTEFSIQLEVENPISGSKAPCAANSISVLRDRVVVAGDDGSIRLADLRGRWIFKVIHHFAAVVKVMSLDKESGLISLGADHRLILWKIEDDDKLNMVSEMTLTGLGDPQNISVVRYQEDPNECLVMVCGSGVQLCRFRV